MRNLAPRKTNPPSRHLYLSYVNFPLHEKTTTEVKKILVKERNDRRIVFIISVGTPSWSIIKHHHSSLVSRPLPIEASSVSDLLSRRNGRRRLRSSRRGHHGGRRRGRCQSRRCSCHRGALEVGRGDLLVVAVNERVREEAGDYKGEGGVAGADRASGDGA